MSVDGVNINTGESAGYDQRGYVFGPYQTHDLNGWRKSASEVAAFSFASASRSYASRTGRPLDVGVIGLAVFKERIVLPAPVPVAPLAESTMRPRPSAAPRSVVEEVVVTGSRVAPDSAEREERLGTAHGARERSFVSRVNFERASREPDLVRRIEYDTQRNLVAAGVIPSPYDPGRRRPRPFPARDSYVPDPPPGS
jgi:hypothetical protein